MSKLSKNILDQIKKENVKPKSRWYFIALHIGIWVAVITTIVFGSLGIAVALRHLSLTDWELAGQISANPLNFMPLLWFGFIALAIFTADQIFKRTKKGYKFKISHVVIASLILSIALGSGFFLVEADQGFESAIRQNIKPYQQWEDRRAAKFVVPHLGVLAGEITEINEEWIVLGFKGQQWKVYISEAELEPGLNPLVGNKVGMMGERLSEEEFKAHHIREFKDTREHLRRRLENGGLIEMERKIRENLPKEELREFLLIKEKIEQERKR